MYLHKFSLYHQALVLTENIDKTRTISLSVIHTKIVVLYSIRLLNYTRLALIIGTMLILTLETFGMRELSKFYETHIVGERLYL